MKVQYAPYFEAASTQAGCRAAEIAAGRRTAEPYSDPETPQRIDVQLIKSTANRGPFRPWVRLKALAASVRVIAELEHNTLIVHAILPRGAETYDEVYELWKIHRTRI